MTQTFLNIAIKIMTKNSFKLILFTGASISLSSCGLFQAPPPPTPNRITHNLSQSTSGTVIYAVNLVPMGVPNPTQAKIVNTAAFRVTQNVLSGLNSAVIIKQDYIITGVYSNDGTTCQISWQGIYPDYTSLEKNHGDLGAGELLNNNSCNPKLGIPPGQLMQIIFK